MSAFEIHELEMKNKDIDAYSEDFNDSAKQALEEPIPEEILQELTSGDIPEFDVVMSKQCTDITHC